MHLSDSELQRWMDGSLGPEGRRRVQRHVDVCEECRVKRDELAWLFQHLREDTVTDVELPADLFEAIMASVADEPLPRRREGRFIAILTVSAVLAIVVGLYAGIGGGLEGWRLWSLEVGIQFAALAHAASGFWIGLKASFGYFGPVIVAIAVTSLTGLAVMARVAVVISRRRPAERVLVEKD